MAHNREHWTSRMGFILAAAGSAVGLGNIWRFPYITGENGGGAFLLIYLAMVFSIGLSLLVAELIIGRSTQLDPAGAFKKLAGGAWPLVGYMGILTAFLILSFYCVIAGWTLAYTVKSITGSILVSDLDQVGSTFNAFITDPLEPVYYTAVFIALTVFVALGGVASGIERAARFLMPALFLILLVLVFRSLTLEGAGEGLAFFLKPDFSKVTWDTLLAALGQAFFSLSLGMGAMITYGSYLNRHDDIATSAVAVTLLDAAVAVLAGLVILPAVFAFGATPSAGPGLTFITLPSIFAQMPFGALFSALFFFLLAIAALTSAVALLEVVIVYFVDEGEANRRKVALIIGVVTFALAVPASLSLGIWSGYTIGGKSLLDALDFFTNNITMPLGGLLVAIFVGWTLRRTAVAELVDGSAIAPVLVNAWHFIIRYVAPLAIVLILVNGLGLI
ncbi:sodium-dependent transporter [Nitratireductor sp. GZWM139]|uniref:sodium-dependent transporter n=1 Tax=Nitratireductor sp. GZWM139 TaxID=2950541 RepID=UPI0024BEB938|nr:sodium-dependent transporter [Nitratireductor sp. GZWM139]MDJ1464601.1 sodium-dependent transporter [Nitratireductor sp. GZWM139]